MRKAIAAAGIALALTGGPASASVTAFLVNCRTATSVTGILVYVGTYQYGGQEFEKTFSSWCPSSIQIR